MCNMSGWFDFTYIDLTDCLETTELYLKYLWFPFKYLNLFDLDMILFVYFDKAADLVILRVNEVCRIFLLIGHGE